MLELGGHLGAVDKASLFDAFERATGSVGLATFVVHVDAAPPIVIDASEQLAALVGRPVAELVGRPPWELLAQSEHARVRDIIASRGPGAPPLTLSSWIERPDGTVINIEAGVARISTPGAELAVCFVRDTTRELAAIEALRSSERRFRSLIEKAPDAIVILQQGRIVMANPIAVTMLGAADFEEVRGRMLADFMTPEEAARARERIAQLYAGAPVRSSEYNITPNNRTVDVHSVLYDFDDKPAILSFVRDVTERRRMQEQLFRNDRLAVLGTMAATVAHEVNNPLTYLQLNLQRLEQEVATEPDPARAAVLREHLTNALHGVERVARIVRDLRAYAGEQSTGPARPVDVIAVVDRALEMVEHDLVHRAELVRRNPTEPAFIDGSAGRLEQVMINLLVNALQSFEGTEPAHNKISVAIELDEAHVTILVSDSGSGLRHPERVFEAFFTTKPAGQGTGLGLSVCKQLVEDMRGRIEIVNTSSKGTTFAVVLPRGRIPVVTATGPAALLAGERLRVLVIDDEPHVLSVMKAVLSVEHDVDIASEGESGLALVGAGAYDVILCDLMMPHMNGRDVYERIRTQWPGLERRVVFVTGGAFVPSLATFLDSVENLKLRKPFNIENALALVREASRRESFAR